MELLPRIGALASLVLACTAALPADAASPVASTSPAQSQNELIRRIQCYEHVRTLVAAAMVYGMDHDGKAPPQLGALLDPKQVPLTTFICPDASNALPANWKTLSPADQAKWVNAHTDYILLHPGQPADVTTAVPMIAEKSDDHPGGDMTVGFSDGHVEVLTPAQVIEKLGALPTTKTTRVPPAPGQPPSIPLISIDQAKALWALTPLSAIGTAVNRFEIDVGRYPTNQEGLAALVQKPQSNADGWKGPYIPSIPNDPWGHPYLYANTGKTPRIYSAGPDGRAGTADDFDSSSPHSP